MARYIENLNSCTDPTSGDYFWVVDASAGATDKDRKVNVGLFAQLAVANTFTNDQTVTGKLIIGSSAPDIARIRPKGFVTVATNAVTVINASALGFLMIMNTSEGASAFFALQPVAVELNDPGNAFSAAKDTAGMANVYVESGNLLLQNKRAGTVNFHIIHFGAAGT